VLGSIDRTDVTVVPKRADVLEHGAWDEAISRATFPPTEWLQVGFDLVKPGGRVWVLLAREDAPAGEIAIDEPYGEGRSRRVIAYARSNP
jgi:hypothetical protein